MHNFKILILLSFTLTGFLTQAQSIRPPQLGMFNQTDKPELDLFAQEGLVDLRSLDLDFVNSLESHGIDKLNSNLNTAVGILNNFGHDFYRVAKDDSFPRIFSASIDSVLSFLETGRPDDIYKFTDPLYMDSLETMKTFCELGKRIQGNLQKVEQVESELVFLKKPGQYYGLLTYKTVFTKARGFLELYFRISNHNQFGFAKMVFTPYDNQPNVFLNAVALNDLQLIKNKDFKTLEANFTSELTQKTEKRKEQFEKELSKFEISGTLFTYRSFIRNGKIYAVPVFNTNKENKVLSIRYLLDGKRFLIDQISVIDKNP